MKSSPKKLELTFLCICITLIVILIAFFILKDNGNNVKDTFYSINNNGQTYGSLVYASEAGTYPDLILVLGNDGIEGYMAQADFLGNSIANYEQYEKEITNEELINHYRNQYKDKYSNSENLKFYQTCYDIPLYDETGENIVGTYTMVIETLPYE